MITSMPSRITSVPLPAEGSSPAVRPSRGRSTSGPGVWLGSPRVDWWRWWGGGRLRWAAAARSRWHTRWGLVSGKASDGEDQHATMGATIGSREELGRVGPQWELAEGWARGGGNGGSADSGCWRCILVHLACSLHFGLDLIMELTRH
jgi:hypothetical protein